MNKSRGRPAGGGPDRQAAILDAAVPLFAEHGYAETTLRMIAHRADCDVALIGYHYGSKRGLFARVMHLTIGPPEVLRSALAGERSGMPARLAAGVLRSWEHPESGERLAAMARASMGEPEHRHTLADYLDRELAGPLVEYLGGRTANERAAAVIGVVTGFIFARYVFALTSVRSVPADRAARTLTDLITTAAFPTRAGAGRRQPEPSTAGRGPSRTPTEG